MSNFDAITPIERYGEWWAKRDDMALFRGPSLPSGGKVRLLSRRAAASPPDAPVVGYCAANSATQICVAAVARAYKRPGIVFVAARARPTEATLWAAGHGAEIRAVRPGYYGVCRRRGRELIEASPGAVFIDDAGIADGAAAQCANIPAGIRRIVVITGSGATAAGVHRGTGGKIPIEAIAVSGMASEAGIRAISGIARGSITVTAVPLAYDVAVAACLPGAPGPLGVLDPFYGAKVLGYLRAGDLLWIPNRRPPEAMPETKKPGGNKPRRASE